MRISFIVTAMSASALAFAAHAQDTQMPPAADAPVGTQPAPSGPPPVDNGTSVPSAPPSTSAPAPDASAVPPAPPPPPSAYNAAPTTPAPGQVQMSPPAPVVQSTPTPPTEYPMCSKTVRDACRNRGEGSGG
jgi:type IV secretory pathway VirB10-like protein